MTRINGCWNCKFQIKDKKYPIRSRCSNPYMNTKSFNSITGEFYNETNYCIHLNACDDCKYWGLRM